MSHTAWVVDQEEEEEAGFFVQRLSDRVVVKLEKLSVSQIKKWISNPKDYRTRQKFIEGDHWQNGAGWVGPLPPIGDATRTDALKLIKKSFTSQNTCREVVERHTDAVAGNDPLWIYTNDEEDVENLNAQMRQWWKKRKMHKLLQKALFMAKWADRAFLRRVIPPSRITDVLIDPLTGDIFTDNDVENLDPEFVSTLEETTVILDLPFAEAVDMIQIELLEPTKGAVVQDTETLREYGLYVYKVGSLEHAEVSYVDEGGLTHLLILIGDKVISDVSLDLGGHLFHYEVELSTLITPQVMDLQKMVNKSYTQASINMDWSAFTERIFLNAQWPYTIEDDGHGGKIRKPKKFETGAATTQWVTGIVLKDEGTGKQTISTPEVKWREPSDPTVFDKAKMMAYRGILQEVRQLHALITGEATTTGESRKQALVEFNKSVEPTKNEADLMGLWLIDGQVRFAGALSTDGPALGLSLKFNTVVEVGPVDANEIRLWNDVRTAGALSLKTFLSKIRVEDVDAEVRLVVEDPVYVANLMVVRLDQLKKVLDLGFDLEPAARLLHFSDDEIGTMTSGTGLQPDTDL